jgi:triacylglycerol esterase/lipase EstA (alpha/beta hydrolase family)
VLSWSGEPSRQIWAILAVVVGMVLALLLTVALVVTAPGGVASATGSAPSSAGSYAPPDRPGPPLDVPVTDLAASLACTGNVAAATREPVLLVAGTALTPAPNFSWNYERAFSALQLPYCAVTLPGHGMSDIQTAGEYIVYALRTMHQMSGRKVDVLGFSQGGMVPRWALRFWPDTRTLVDDLVAIDPSNHGTLDANGICALSCAPSIWQQRTGSHFLAALNSAAETFAGISYSVVYSRVDEVAFPNLDASGSSSLHTGGGAVVNIAAQQICPADVSEHLAMGSYDPVAYAVALDAFTHPGPAEASRIPTSVCTTPFQPGVDPLTFPADYASYALGAVTVVATYPHTGAEPALARYVWANPPPSP